MKQMRWLGLIVLVAFPLISANAQVPAAPASQGPDGLGQSQSVTAAPVSISPGAAEVVKLAESGSSDDVILAFIKNSESTFNLSADGVIYLKDVGLSSPVVTAMLTHDNSLRSQTPQYTYDQKAYPPSGQAQVAQPTPQPAVPEQPNPIEPAAATPTYVSNPPAQVNYFYNDLSPYGSWVELEGYGWCWQPRTVVVDRAWQPYCNGGHWVYTDDGWFWQSDYSWGWATFHYGRWHRHERCGWVWLPDTVWAPAWVTWRVSGDHCGWAPLPPHADFDARLGFRFNGVSVRADFDFGLRADRFTFVALKDFNDRDLGHRRLPATQARNVYNQTTILNNYTVNNNVIVNRGIAVERVAAVTHGEIKKVAIRDLPGNSRRAVAGTPLVKGEAAVYRPQLKAPVRPTSMVAQKVDDRHPMIQHNAVLTPKGERPLTTVNGGLAPIPAPHRPQVEAPNSPQRPGGDRPATSLPGHSFPDAHSYPVQNTPQKQPETGPQKNQGQNPRAYYPGRNSQPHSPSQFNQNQAAPPAKSENGSSPQSKRDGF
jgi:hypothetical protein